MDQILTNRIQNTWIQTLFWPSKSHQNGNSLKGSRTLQEGKFPIRCIGSHNWPPVFPRISSFFPWEKPFRRQRPLSLSSLLVDFQNIWLLLGSHCTAFHALLNSWYWTPTCKTLNPVRSRNGFGVSLTARWQEVPFLHGIPCWLRVWEHVESIPCCFHGASGRCCSDCKQWKYPRFKLLQPINSGWCRAWQPSLCAVFQVGFKT